MTDDATNELVKPQNEGDPKPCTPDDLIELIRAIKFAHTEMSIRNVHKEISVTMANSDKSYDFLKDVKLNDVKKVWKKALKGRSPETNNSSQKSEPTLKKNSVKSPARNDLPIVPTEGIIKFYTVGDGSVATLAENYANHHAEAAVAASQDQNADSEKEKGKYTHFFLDVPADLSGSRPHQALMNYQHTPSGKKGKNKAGQAKKLEGKEAFKIQLAALPPGMEHVQTPMLMYNSDRSAKTFLHPPSSPDDTEDDGGYLKIRKIITESGISGALGATGGQKAYFYGFVTKTKSGPNVISIDVHSGLVPSQTW